MKRSITLVFGAFILGACSQDVETDVAGTWDMDYDRSLAASIENFGDENVNVMSIEFTAGLLSDVEISESGVMAKDNSFELNCTHTNISEDSATSDCALGMMGESDQFVAEWALYDGDDADLLTLEGLENMTVVMTRAKER